MKRFEVLKPVFLLVLEGREEKKRVVLVMAESEDVEKENQKSGNPKRRCGYFKMKVLQTQKEIVPIVHQNLEIGATAYTDQHPSDKNVLGELAKHH